MNEKQAIAEAERRFENWWNNEGFQKWIITVEIASQHKKLQIKSLLKEAWINGAFVARENN